MLKQVALIIIANTGSSQVTFFPALILSAAGLFLLRGVTMNIKISVFPAT